MIKLILLQINLRGEFWELHTFQQKVMNILNFILLHEDICME